MAMAYHVPPPTLPPSYTSSTNSIQSELEGHDSHSEEISKPLASTQKRKSSTKMPGVLKRAMSSPTVGSLGSAESSGLSADKKRNKLGYHRTAVACGHCRRRKIRCIPAYEDTHGRCQNCIRLKKDCHFFPVDQQAPVPGRRARTGSKAESQNQDRDDSASSSSPGILVSSSLEHIKQVNGQMGTPPLSQDGSSQSFGPPSVGPRQSEFVHPSDYGYAQNYEHPSRMSQFPNQSPHIASNGHPFDNNPSHYFQHPDQPMHSSFGQQPYTPYSSSMTTSPQSQAFNFHQTSPGSEYGWAPPPPVRSLSIADTEDLRTFAAYRSNTYPNIARRMSSTHDVPQDASGSGEFTGPDSNHGRYHDPSIYSQMQIPTSMAWSVQGHGAPVVPTPGTESYSQSWYGSQSALPLLREEEDQAHNRNNFPPNPG